MNITFKQMSENHINIYNKDKIIGHIFSPSGSGNNYENGIQVCGFSEAFDYWGCGIFKGKKDIQLHFDDKLMEGKPVENYDINDCLKCYMKPCACKQDTWKIKRLKDDKLVSDTDTEHSNSHNTQVEKPQQDGKSERVQTSNSGLDVSSVAQQPKKSISNKYEQEVKKQLVKFRKDLNHYLDTLDDTKSHDCGQSDALVYVLCYLDRIEDALADAQCSHSKKELIKNGK